MGACHRSQMRTAHVQKFSDPTKNVSIFAKIYFHRMKQNFVHSHAKKGWANTVFIVSVADRLPIQAGVRQDAANQP
jgi:hypothetical protein